MNFTDFNLHPDLQRGITDAEYLICTPVQEQVLTNAFGGQDLYVQSQTGTGKTAAYLIVMLQRLMVEPLLHGKGALIMTPTRELAVQVEEEAKMLAKYLPFKTGSFYGGVGYTEQRQLLKDNTQIMVGTPGRVIDLNKSGLMNLMDIAFLVLDEADRMLDMGFQEELHKLIKVVPPVDKRQTMLFSATLNAWVKNIAWEYTKSPYEIEIAPETVTVDAVEQMLYHVPSDDKMKLLVGILRRELPESVVIFCNTKRYTEVVANRLRINGFECEFIIGDLPQSKRLTIIDDIKAGKTKCLVATDVAARGLDIEDLSMVINYDLPVETENYVHRIGRTARAGKSGRAITLASEQDVYELPAIERYIGKKIPSETATPELYAEDKSEHTRTRAGMRVDTGRPRREQQPRERPARDTARRKTVRADNAGAGEASPRSTRRDGHEPAPRRKSGTERGRPRRRPLPDERRVDADKDEKIWKGITAQTEDGKDLSALSFDERMAYYRQKYESKSSTARLAGLLDAPAARGKGKSKPDTSTAQSAAPPTPSEAEPSPRSLLSRVFGIFKGKKGEE